MPGGRRELGGELMPHSYSHRRVPDRMTAGLHILYFLLGFPTCGLAWLVWLVHAVAISNRTRTEYTQTWIDDERAG